LVNVRKNNVSRAVFQGILKKTKGDGWWRRTLPGRMLKRYMPPFQGLDAFPLAGGFGRQAGRSEFGFQWPDAHPATCHPFAIFL
jgi:hypothetical protein